MLAKPWFKFVVKFKKSDWSKFKIQLKFYHFQEVDGKLLTK